MALNEDENARQAYRLEKTPPLLWVLRHGHTVIPGRRTHLPLGSSSHLGWLNRTVSSGCGYHSLPDTAPTTEGFLLQSAPHSARAWLNTISVLL